VSPSGPNGQASRLGTALLALAAAAFGLAVWIWTTGGFRLPIAGALLSARTPWPPALSGLALVASLWLVRRRRLSADLAALDAALVRREPALALALALLTFIAGLAFGSTVAAGADSSGYISQASLWRAGRLHVPEPAILESDRADAAWAFAPLGFRPGLQAGTIVPSYPPGLPLQFALAAALLGDRGIAVVVPLLGAIAVWLAFVLGRAGGGPGAGLAAATLVASSPVFLYQLVQPMSDVPVIAWWLAALGLLLIRDRPRPLAAGVAAGIAIATRPNLAPVLVVVVPLLLSRPAGGRHGPRRGWTLRDAGWFTAGAAPLLLLLAWFNDHLYGAPWTSGYGDAGQLFSLSHVGVNAARYARWLLDTHPVLLVLAAAGLAAAAVRADATRAPQVIPTAAGTATLVTASYLAYAPFESWTYLRFLLPAIAALAIPAGAAWSLALRASPAWLRLAAATVGLALVGGLGVGHARAAGALEIGAHEQRYRLLAEWVRQHTPRDAFVLCGQHSGSIRHTAARTIVRWDLLPVAPEPAADAEVVPGLEGTRLVRPIVIVLDADEEPAFRARLGQRHPLGRLDWPPRAATSPPPSARVYLARDAAEYGQGAAIVTELIALPRRP
jgi:hypothetical protein